MGQRSDRAIGGIQVQSSKSGRGISCVFRFEPKFGGKSNSQLGDKFSSQVYSLGIRGSGTKKWRTNSFDPNVLYETCVLRFHLDARFQPMYALLNPKTYVYCTTTVLLQLQLFRAALPTP